MKALVQDVRFRVFSIIDTLMANHREGISFLHLLASATELLIPVLKSKGKEFLDGYISLAEGEKDPRNLMIAFAIARVVIIEFDISFHVEVPSLLSRLQVTRQLASRCSISYSVTFLSHFDHRRTISMALARTISRLAFGEY